MATQSPITIVDYGAGNPTAVCNMLNRVGARATITADPELIARAEKLIVPGVGAFDQAMRMLRTRGLVELLQERVVGQKVPVLGICLGFQLLTSGSDEGTEPGLGWIAGRSVRFDAGRLGPDEKIPHMGWADVTFPRETRLFGEMPDEPCFYFAHSYCVECERDDDVAATAVHGYRFVAAVEHDNVAGVQFHPEKSHKFGMALLRNFAQRF